MLSPLEANNEKVAMDRWERILSPEKWDQVKHLPSSWLSEMLKDEHMYGNQGPEIINFAKHFADLVNSPDYTYLSHEKYFSAKDAPLRNSDIRCETTLIASGRTSCAGEIYRLGVASIDDWQTKAALSKLFINAAKALILRDIMLPEPSNAPHRVSDTYGQVRFSKADYLTMTEGMPTVRYLCASG
jgi:hypothetical protein